MSPIPVQAVIWIVGVIFAAGGGWMMLRQARKDVNGIGARQRKFEKNLVLVLMVNAANREDRMFLAQFLKE